MIAVLGALKPLGRTQWAQDRHWRIVPHDLRHYWVTKAARNRTPVKNLQKTGSWNSPEMPLHYIEAEQVATDGVIL